MESNFHSTVLQRPPGLHDYDEDDDRRRRDILNPPHAVSGGAQSSPAHGPPPPRQSFNLRSPTQADFHHPPPFPASPSSSSANAPSRSVLHNPFISPSTATPSLPPSSASTTVAASSSAAAGSSAVTSNLQPPPRSPLHAPPIFFPQDRREPPREKSAGSFYDPTTDTTTTTKERRISDSPSSWHNATQSSTPKPRDSYNYPSQAPIESGSYYNGKYTSPVASSLPPRSPISHSHPHPATGSISPPSRAPQMASPSLRHANGGALASTGMSTPAAAFASSANESPAPSVLKAPVPSTSTPSRAAELMSFSNILSSAEPVSKPRPKSPVIEKPVRETNIDKAEKAEKAEKKERKERAPRKPSSRARASDIKKSETTPKSSSRRASSHKETPSQVRLPAKRQANGHLKQKTFSADKEKKIRDLMEQFDSQVTDAEDFNLDEEEEIWKQRAQRRRREIESREAAFHRLRRGQFTDETIRDLSLHTDLGKRRYDDLYYDEALQEVREQEIFAEKERKKDMQRKRRREKSMAVTIEQKEAALAKALAAEDETERQKHLREAERANKKAQQTKLILQKGIKGPARNLAPLELNLEGGTMATFQATDMEPGKPKPKGRSGPRPKKSKEQKQAEKDSAEAAQAALDAGEELPTKEETSKIRIKLNKSKAPKDEGDKDKDSKKDLKEAKEKEKAAEEPKDPLETKFQSKGFNQIYDQIWRDLARKDVNKVYKLAVDSYATKASNLKKTAILASKEAKRWQLRTNKGTKDLQARAKRVMRDMMSFWKRNEREERDLRKAAEKQELENARKEEADREAARQKRKLNFLISQTELYSHFIGKKIKTHEVERSTDNPDIATEDQDKAPEPAQMDDGDELAGPVGSKVTDFENLDFDAEDESQLRAAARANAQNAIAEAQQKARAFNQESALDEEGEMNFQNPTGMGDVEIEQPKLLNAQLKEYQLKGLNWLVNLYEQGINGILADEMGLGKTVQSISVMAYLAEKYDIWGPYLVVAPASTLHNWEQEIRKFVPEFKVLPYWGSAPDRKTLRKFWDRKHGTYKKEASFHVMVTSYQLVVSDNAYFQKMKWQYMILDEAQAIKSSQSSRWKCLLGFHCRNRLLLTGTPIQNNMQELWALLHFIMPSLFDSHDEFSEWFSKDIESHAQSNTKLNEDQLKRLHMILKPFMLRRVKKHVQKELGDKIELDVFCDLTYRQRAYYSNLRNQISIMDLIEKATTGDDSDSGTLMNLVMQFRKVCNHPDLFERAETTSPFSCGYFAETASFLREGNNVAVGYSTRNIIQYELPRLVWRDGGRLHKPGADNAKAGFRNKYLDHMMNIWTPDNIRGSVQDTGSFSWLRFADASPGEVYHASHQDVFARATELARRAERLGAMNVAYDEEDSAFTPAHALFQIVERADRRPLADITAEGVLKSLMNVSRSAFSDCGLGRLEQAGRPGASAPPIEVVCSSRGANIEREDTLFNVPMRRALYGPNLVEEKALILQKVRPEKYPPTKLLPAPDNEKKRFNNIEVPSMRRFVTDSGKLAKLDELLFKLKEGGHRVLLYFQMTRMIDLMEEYLTYRNYKFCRLDGSTKLEDRRDTVHDFQTRPEIFIFLLSTRAGGLGINLTSADTVIFYDSDWNPTIDSQAMDRAHRLGQTRQVTVYRLITRGTIEERIRKRALQKEEVQRVVIQGGGAGAGVDFSGRRAPENRNKDIAMWLADDDDAVEKMIERREKELLESGESEKKKKSSKRKRVADTSGTGVSLDDMYHEGEGHFDDKPSGTATPVADGDARAGKRKRPSGSKKAKTAKQRLAIADGEVD
ncbi:Chromatin remodelling factor 2-1 [Pleurostoma richardsiae]|uniref:Chromatin-remodeling ATPase INO80 n=1 Tax=Pleurostoma richardsiae TaxID=41990 RepID=A0AA38VM63_9PEZI|nr:Chromatin remodelling factor 2-1 [Pleurostoma richardsiae]